MEWQSSLSKDFLTQHVALVWFLGPENPLWVETRVLDICRGEAYSRDKPMVAPPQDRDWELLFYWPLQISDLPAFSNTFRNFVLGDQLSLPR